MEKFQFDQNFEIYYFKRTESSKELTTSLNEFIAFLKFNKVSIPHKFSYVGAHLNLIPELTLKQNLLLDYTSHSLTEEKDEHFRNFLKNRANTHLESLYTQINNMNELPVNATNEEIKIVILMRALISEMPFIFLERPEKDLTLKSFSLFKEALKFQFKEQGQNIFIATEDEFKWADVISKVVTRNENFTFRIDEPNEKIKFLADRKKFFQNNEEEKTEAPLFIFPNKSKKPNAA